MAMKGRVLSFVLILMDRFVYRRQVHWREEEQGENYCAGLCKYVGDGESFTASDREVCKARCFKNCKVPVEYEANKKAWMTGVLFDNQLKKWDKKFKKENRKVLFYLDNCPAHPLNLKLDSVRIKFFPPNTTASSQGVIQNLKVHHRKLLLHVRISELEAGNNYKVSLLDSLHLLRRAWGKVTKETIKNCFRQAKFIHKESTEEEEASHEADEEDELLNAWNSLDELGGIDERIAIEDFLNVDELVETCGALTLTEILKDISRAEEESEVSDSDVISLEEVETELPVSRFEAQCAFTIARRYVENNSVDPAVLHYTDALDDYFYEERRKKKQSRQ